MITIYKFIHMDAAASKRCWWIDHHNRIGISGYYNDATICFLCPH